jgi:hypothetical protein
MLFENRNGSGCSVVIGQSAHFLSNPSAHSRPAQFRHLCVRNTTIVDALSIY